MLPFYAAPRWRRLEHIYFLCCVEQTAEKRAEKRSFSFSFYLTKLHFSAIRLALVDQQTATLEPSCLQLFFGIAFNGPLQGPLNGSAKQTLPSALTLIDLFSTPSAPEAHKLWQVVDISMHSKFFVCPIL